MTRDEALNHFLAGSGWGNAKRVTLASDASSRTYDRLFLDNKTAILMNSPLSENPAQFVFIDRLLRQAGVCAPKILSDDLENGFLLLEDFGDDTFTHLLSKGANEYDLYKKGVDTLIQLQKNIALPIENVPVYSTEKLMRVLMLFPNWFGKYVVPDGLSEEAVNEFREIWTPLTEQMTLLPQSLILLDYHVDNLMLTPKGNCGVLDFQDARIGPVTYDLISLLEDERRDVSADVREKLLEYYFKQCSEVDTESVRTLLPVVAMHRHTTVIGIFTRLFMRDKKEKYLNMIPFVWELTERHLNNPIFKSYKNWLDHYIPADIRHQKLTPEFFE